MTDKRITTTFTVNTDEDTARFPDLVLRQTIRQLAINYVALGMPLEVFRIVVQDEVGNDKMGNLVTGIKENL